MFGLSRTTRLKGLLARSLLCALWAGAGHDASAGSEPNRNLVDHRGQEMTASRLAGHYLLVYFGYTSCPDICPTTLATLSRTLGLLGSQGEAVLPLFVTVDPAKDTVDVIRSYVGHFDRRLIGLTGSPEAVAAARNAFGVTAQRRERDQPGNDAFDHSLFIYFAGPDGKVLRTFHANQSAASIAGEMRKLLPVAVTQRGAGS
jgi:protein SCO1/2